MRYRLLALDFDGTLAEHGVVPESTLDVLRRIRASGRKLAMVTGRRLEPLLELCPWIELFDRVVVENGAVLYRPESREEALLVEPPHAHLVSRLRAKGVDNVEGGRVIVATWRPHEIACLEAISELALDLQIVFNKDAVMLLPSGCNKASGLAAALAELEISPLNVVAAGDAENDEAMLRMAGVSVAVDNALEPVKAICDIVTPSPRGAGVSELCERILADDLVASRTRQKHCLALGERLDGTPLLTPPYGESVFVTGGPGGGKSKFATSFLERLQESGAQYCVVDPEGDYRDLDDSIAIGTVDRAPSIEELVQALKRPDLHAVASFFAVEKKDRPAYFDRLFRALSELRSRTGRPHWIVVDEAHYMAPKGWEPAAEWSSDELKSIMFVTAFPEWISDAVLNSVDWIVSIADDPRPPLAECAERLGESLPTIPAPEDGDEHHALAWRRGEAKIFWFRRIPTEGEHRRHRQSLWEGEIDEDARFVFRGAQEQLNLKAKNLREFISLAEGLDDETWTHHLGRKDYSRWFDEVVKDSELVETAVEVEKRKKLSPKESRQAIFDKIRERFETSSSG